MKYVLAAVLAWTFVLPRFVWADTIIDIAFPVNGESVFYDDYFSARSGGRIHAATDIMADKLTPVVAAVDGVITFAPMTEPSYGYMLTLAGDDGYVYNYIHLNNDTPGTDDSNGGSEHAYVAGIVEGARVERGEHIAWVGDSGNAEAIAAHLHFEIETSNHQAINPYASLLAAQDSVLYDPAAELNHEVSINQNQNIPQADHATNCTSDSLIRTPETSTVYYCGQDGGRYIFLDESTYQSWYTDFEAVEYVTAQELAAIPLNGVVTYKPGVYMVKVPSVPKVYVVAPDSTLRWVTSAEIAEGMYGTNWGSLVRDLPESFFPRYTLGEDIN